MLTITENARVAIESILSGTPEPGAAGLRIAQSPNDQDALAASITTAPAEGDTVLEQSGARVFLEPVAAIALDDKTLDALTSATGNVEFRIN